jgi:hypothetical protein
VNVGFSKRPKYANNKKIQSSKSWYLKIALILSIENPLPRGVVDRTVNTNPEERRLSPPCNIYKIRENIKVNIFDLYNSFYTDVQAALHSEPQPGPSAYFLAW